MHHWISSDSRLIFNIITDFRFADDIDGLAGTDEELRELIKTYDIWYGDKISMDKTNVMTNKDSYRTMSKFCNSNTLVQKYPTEAQKQRSAQGSKAMGKLQYIWSSNTITLKIKLKLNKLS